MAGLGLLLDAPKKHHNLSKNSPQILNKALMLKAHPSLPNPTPTPTPTSFLDACNLCSKKLSHEKDIYMYRGDGAFCSEECRDRQIFIDEESVWKEKCSLSASSSPSSSSRAKHSKVVRKRAATGGLFAH